jgi:hypothetical protein
VRRSLHLLGVLLGRHAEYEDLLAYRDGEVSRIAQWCMTIHLGRCKSCRRETELIGEDLQAFQKMDRLLYGTESLNLSAGLQKLRHSIENWEAHGRAGEPPMAIYAAGLRLLAREFTTYLGNRPATTLLAEYKNGKSDQRNTFGEAESILRDFLGPGAASAVMQRVSHAQMLRVRSVERPQAS